nr:neuropeptide CCHamide-2 [Vanessa tameamea]
MSCGLLALSRELKSARTARPGALFNTRYRGNSRTSTPETEDVEMAQNILTLSVMAVLVFSVGVSAKRGCSAFGHSCFGGHGKRSGDSGDNMMDTSNSELMANRQLGQEETPPHPIYPHSGYGNLPGDDIIPVRDGGVYDREENNMRDAVKMKLRNILKYWMDNYRRSRLNNEDGYYIENL